CSVDLLVWVAQLVVLQRPLYGVARVLALAGLTGTREELPLDHPELLAVVKPALLIGRDVLGGEETYPGEAEVLVLHKHLHRHQVRLTQVVDEPADVAVLTRIDAVCVPIL
ncbi:hypothetical protein EGW08_022350, partial [Elysia chlorotica]